MTRIIRAGLLCSVVIVLIGCKDEPAPMLANIVYTACVGQLGTCSGTGCCANQYDRHIGEEARLDCEIRAGSTESSYRLNFSADSPNNDGSPMIVGTDLQFNSGTTQPQPLRSCGGFLISEDGNDYESDVCDNLDVRADGGGGCQLQFYIDENNVVVGAFQCKELDLPGGPLYLSTIHQGDVGYGEVHIENCDFRL